MLSYRHAFHAGNAADVHKHAAWQLGIDALLKKEAGFCLFDAYAGAGEYDLTSDIAAKTAEWREGVERVFKAAGPPAVLQNYLEILSALNSDGELRCYPGSPRIAAENLRAQDRLICLELHPADHARLEARFARNPRVHVHRRDAREGLAALLPPAERRGLVLVDPPYERRAEYDEVPQLVIKAHARWPQGGYLVWYPLLAANPHEQMLQQFAASGIRRILRHEVLLFPDAPGLHGSGLLWINPPWQMDGRLSELGDDLCARLGSRGANSRLEWFVPE